MWRFAMLNKRITTTLLMFLTARVRLSLRLTESISLQSLLLLKAQTIRHLLPKLKTRLLV